MKAGQWRTCAILIALLMSLSTPNVYAEEEPLLLQPAEKLARGVTNLATGWLEVPKQIYEVGEREGWVVGLLRGPIDGLGMSMARTIAGVYEVFTFPIPAPLHYQPLLQPAYVWNHDPSVEPVQAVSIPSHLQQAP